MDAKYKVYKTFCKSAKGLDSNNVKNSIFNTQFHITLIISKIDMYLKKYCKTM